MQPYNAGKIFYRDPIEISALSLLLDGRSLTYKQHAKFLKELIVFAAALQVHNDQVRVTNLA